MPAVEMGPIRDALARLCERHEWLIVEGAGGLLVPAARGLSMADLCREFELPLLIAARAALGTINHTLLTLEAAAARGLDVLGVVISHADGELSSADSANLVALRDALGPRLLGEVPPLACTGPLATAESSSRAFPRLRRPQQGPPGQPPVPSRPATSSVQALHRHRLGPPPASSRPSRPAVAPSRVVQALRRL